MGRRQSYEEFTAPSPEFLAHKARKEAGEKAAREREAAEKKAAAEEKARKQREREEKREQAAIDRLAAQLAERLGGR